MKIEKYIDWEEVKAYQKEHPLYKKPPREKKRKKKYKRKLALT